MGELANAGVGGAGDGGGVEGEGEGGSLVTSHAGVSPGTQEDTVRI